MVNQQTITQPKNELTIGAYATRIYTLASNNAVKRGQAMGLVKSSSKVIPVDSTASDGSQYVIGIAFDDVASQSSDAEISMVVMGTVWDSKVVFKNSDTLETFVTGSSYNYRDQLRALNIYAQAKLS